MLKSNIILYTPVNDLLLKMRIESYSIFYSFSEYRTVINYHESWLIKSVVDGHIFHIHFNGGWGGLILYLLAQSHSVLQQAFWGNSQTIGGHGLPLSSWWLSMQKNDSGL